MALAAVRSVYWPVGGRAGRRGKRSVDHLEESGGREWAPLIKERPKGSKAKDEFGGLGAPL